MRLSSFLVTWSGHGSLKCHIEVAENVIPKILEAVSSVIWVV
jgi:hypothetical protein